jgi:tetratricopeptide (TPR) repeat protein
LASELAAASDRALRAWPGASRRASQGRPPTPCQTGLRSRDSALSQPEAALKQLSIVTALFEREFGFPPGPAVHDAAQAPEAAGRVPTDESSIAAMLEAGSAAVAAGAIEAGVQSLRAGVSLSDAGGVGRLRVRSRLALAEALIHSLRGRDEEGIAALHAAGEIALADSENELAAAVRAELGYVDFLRARYDRAERWLREALQLGDGPAAVTAKATMYLGSVESDGANYPQALIHLEEASVVSRTIGDQRSEAFASSMIGRIHLLRGDLDNAALQLENSIELAESDRWLAFVPWPQALRGEVELARFNPDGASEHLQQAFARACQLGDPCWEGMAARGIALATELAGDPEEAFHLLADARIRCNRLSDPYVWLDGYILDAQCVLGLRHQHPETSRWIGRMHELASRTGMKELVVRSLLHRAAMGGAGDAEAAALLGAEIDNSALHRLLPMG